MAINTARVAPGVTLGDAPLTIDDVLAVAVRHEQVELSDAARQRIDAAYRRVERFGEAERPMYGVNTGFGEMVHVKVPRRFKSDLQVNLLRGHAAGGGECFDAPVVRAIMLARLAMIARGYSGVGPATVDLLTALLNHDILPVVPEQGSLGASGDLAPLSHLALPLIGEGEVTVDGERMAAREALDAHGLEPVELSYKEGLALVNGTSATTATGLMALSSAFRLLNVAVLLSAVAVKALRGSTRPYEAIGHELKGHPGQIAVAARMAELLRDGGLTRDHGTIMAELEGIDGSGVTETDIYLQDAYSLRCVPQILGPVVETLEFCRRVLETELNSCNDNPLILDSAEQTFHGGNFHAQYSAMACDYMAIALTEIGVLAERQVNRLVDPHINSDLPPFLAVEDGGLAIGLMGLQYLATSIAAENLNLAGPSSVTSIPSNGQNQDVVSMGLNAARRCRRLADNVGTIIGVLGATCLQAIHLRGADGMGAATREWFDELSAVASAHDESAPVYELARTCRTFHVDGPGGDLAERTVALG